MEFVLDILNSQNFGRICILIIVLVLFCMYALKKGWIKGRIKNIVIGSGAERRIIREQLMWSKAELDVYFNDLIYANAGNPTFDKLRCLYSKLIVYVIITNCIALNHIVADDVYIDGVVQRVWGELSGVELSEKFITTEFRNLQKKEITKIIKKLVEIRNFYQNKELT